LTVSNFNPPAADESLISHPLVRQNYSADTPLLAAGSFIENNQEYLRKEV
jgi:hypothetical protein